MIATIDTADGERLEYRVWYPAAGAPRASLVLLNGVMSHSAWFDPLARPLVGQGYKVVGADRRGTGTNQKDRGDAPSAKALVDDVRAIIQKERLKDRPVHLIGWCWGAVLAVNVAFEAKGELSSLILLAPGLFATDTLKENMASQDPTAPFFESPIKEEMFTKGAALDDFICKDVLRTRQFTSRFHQIMQKMGTTAQVRLPRLDLPILLVLAEDDAATDNQATRRAFERLPGERVKIEMMKSAHGMQFDVPDRLAESIDRFVSR